MQEGRVGSLKSDIEYVPPAQSVGKRIARKSNTILKIAILVIILIIAFNILLNPGMSPISSIRDTDGDGVADCFDKAWLNSSVWNQAYAKIFVVFTNMDLYNNTSYICYFEGAWKKSGTLGPLESELITISVDWLYGKNSSKTFSLITGYISSNPSERHYPQIDVRTIEVNPNDSISVGSYY